MGFLKYKDSYVVNPDGDKVNPLMMLIGEKDGESYGEMYIFLKTKNFKTYTQSYQLIPILRILVLNILVKCSIIRNYLKIY